MTARPLVSYEPNPILAWLYHRFFERIEVDAAWLSAVREADARGTVVYALRNLSFVDFFALDYLTKRYLLPQVRFANDLGLWVLEPMGRGWLRALQPKDELGDAEDLKRAVTGGSSAALFLKRPPAPVFGSRRGKSEGDPYLRSLFEAQRTQEKPILIVPQVFVWSKRPDQAAHTLVDSLLGPREWPGKVRTIAQFLANYRDVTLRAGEPVDLKQFLAQEGNGAHSDAVLVRRLTYVLLRRLERERRAVIGPTMKPADRLREEVIRSPKLQKIIADMAGEGESERQVITGRALAMIREMEAALDMGAVKAIEPGFQVAMSRMYSAMEIDEPGLARVREAARSGALILLPSHKSHVDYMVVTYIFLKHHLQLPLIAAGDNLNFFPLGAVFRRAGAFFIRRSFGSDRLYGAVVDAYVRRLIKDGWSLEFFLEGGRSRTGKLLPPKVGLLSLVVDASLGGSEKNVSFVPISIGYERVVEEKSFVREVSGGEKSKEDVRGLLASANAIAQRYGHLNVQFGEILTLDQVLRELDPKGPASGDGASAQGAARSAREAKLTPAKRRAVVTRLAYMTMNEINRVTAVTPGALVATALLTHAKRGLPQADLAATCERLASMLRRFGARFTPSLTHESDPARIRASALYEACDLFVRAEHVVVRTPGGEPARWRKQAPGPDSVYVVPDESRLSLDLSKNILVHFFVSRAMIATPLVAGGGAVAVSELRERVQALSRLFKYEFMFRADAPFDQIFDETVAEMARDGELALRDDTIAIPTGDLGENVALYAEVVRNFVEGYRVAARALTALLKGALAPKDLAKRAIAVGDRMFLAGELERREAVSQPLFDNAQMAFLDQGYLTRAEGKLALAASYAQPAAVKTIESRVAGFLPRARLAGSA